MENKKALYENVFVPSEKDVGDYIVHVIKKRSAFSVLIPTAVLITVFLFWWWLGAMGVINSPFLHLMAALVLLVSIMATDSFVKHREFQRLTRKFKRQNEDEMAEVRTRFYEDEIEANGKSFRYAEFTRVFYGESCMFLVSEGGKVLLVKDDAAAFGQEDYAPFWDFLNGKCTLKAPEKKSRSAFSLRSPLE